MQIETLEDILSWTRLYHSQLSQCLKHCSDENEEQRAKMLLVYLSDHENRLEKVIEIYEKKTNKAVLNTWFYEYRDKHPAKEHLECTIDFSIKDISQIISQTMSIHNQIIDLYKYLRSRSEVPSVSDVLDQLVDLESHEAMVIAQSSNRLMDL